MDDQIGAELYLENIVDNFPGHIYWKDLKGKYLGCNKRVAENAGFSSVNDLIGKTDFDLWPQVMAEDYRKNDLYVIESKKNLQLWMVRM
jgi:PAS domain-containing protein